MPDHRLLLLSNSRNHGQQFLEHARGLIQDFLGNAPKRLAFVPYAGVTISFGEYTKRVRSAFDALGYSIVSVHETNAADLINDADAIVVGGGNTFCLVDLLYRHELTEPIRTRARAGVPYIGWSAGSNMACPTIRTTNDMPIVEPESFDALGLIPFQINPHYLDAHPEKHQGETREDRLKEFIEANRDVYVAGLREGSILRVEGSSLELIGDRSLRVFKHGHDARELSRADSLDFLLRV